jgi:hypothetical protein
MTKRRNFGRIGVELPEQSKFCKLKRSKLICQKKTANIKHNNFYMVPQSWYRTKVVPIAKPGKDPLISGSYRPGRKLMYKMICLRLDFWEEKNGLWF